MTTLNRIALFSVLVASVAACGSESASGINGRVSDDSSTARVGGEGSVDAAVEVRAVVRTSGSTEVIGTADVEADGSYFIEIDDDVNIGADTVVVQAVDEDDAIVASTLIASLTADADGNYDAAPMTTETSVEAEVWLSVAERYGDDKADPVDARIRIDAEVSAEVTQGGDVEGDIDALADAMVTSFEAEASVWAESGGSLTAETRADAMADVMADYDAALAAGSDIAARWDAVVDARFDAAASAGLEAEDRADAETAAGLALRAVLDARSDNEDLFDGMVVTSGRLEAFATAEAMTDLYAEANPGDEAEGAMADAAAELRADLEAASSADAAASAWAEFESTLLDSPKGDSVFGLSLDTNILTDTALQLALSTSTEASAALESSIAAEAGAMSGDTIDASAMANATVTAWTDYRASVDTAFEVLFQDDADASLASELVVNAQGRFLLTD